MRGILVLALGLSLGVGCADAPEERGSEATAIWDGEFDATQWRRVEDRSAVMERRRERDRSNEKRDVLVYYAVDTEEPFMQAAVDYEVRSLRAVCKPGNASINWIALLNSHYVYNARKVLLCRGGVFAEEKLPSLDDLISKISNPRLDPAKPASAGLTIKLPHKREFNAMFKKYPYAHPEVLAKVLEIVSERYFDAQKHQYVLHLKSHGSDELLLSGLTAEQLKKKTDRQKGVLEEHIAKVRKAARDSDGDIDVRNRVACEARGARWTGKACYCPSSKLYINQFFGACEWKPGEAGLGAAKASELGFDFIGLGQTTVSKKGALGETGMGESGMGETGMGETGMGETGMGETGMGETGMGESGMGETGLGFQHVGADGLGINGLGAEAHFGTPHAAMVEVLKRVKKKNMRFSFIVFESCDSKVRASRAFNDAFENELDNVDAYYSAEGSLWYRNYDWDRILFRAEQSRTAETVSMSEILAEWSRDVPTFIAMSAY